MDYRPSLSRETAMNDPFARLPVVPSFAVTSTDVTDGLALPAAQMSGIFQVPGGKDLSPQLSWSGAPAETKCYTVTMYDPDEPSRSGFWHWAVADIPASVAGLPTGGGRHRRAPVAGDWHREGRTAAGASRLDSGMARPQHQHQRPSTPT